MASPMIPVALADVQAFASRFWSHVQKGPGCWIWTLCKRGPYGVVRLGGRKGRTIGAHRIAYELANGPIDDGLHVCHHCDNPPCVRPDHLFVGTPADNHKDRMSKGLRKPGTPGERHPSAKLNEAQVREIRAATGPYAEIASRFGIAEGTISNIRARRIWKSVS